MALILKAILRERKRERELLCMSAYIMLYNFYAV